MDKIIPWKTKTLYTVNYSTMAGNYAKKMTEPIGQRAIQPVYNFYIQEQQQSEWL